jgi:putative Holliday junction resolvase
VRVLALDPGSRRIGVALSDELGILASPLTVITRTTRVADLNRVRALIEQYRPSEVLVGLPVLPSGDLGPQAQTSQRLADAVRESTGVPTRFWNESYSTVEAHRRRHASGHSRKRGGSIDAEAAAVFLQDYLDSNR